MELIFFKFCFSRCFFVGTGNAPRPVESGNYADFVNVLRMLPVVVMA